MLKSSETVVYNEENNSNYYRLITYKRSILTVMKQTFKASLANKPKGRSSEFHSKAICHTIFGDNFVCAGALVNGILAFSCVLTDNNNPI